MQADTPKFRCEPVKGFPQRWLFWCPYCRRNHVHSAGEGHRAAHCLDGSPLKEGGYEIELDARFADCATVIEWRNPIEETPPFNTPLLLAIGCHRSRGARFVPEITIYTASVMQEDTEGDEDAGDEMVADLNGGECKWSDLQFRILDDDGDPLDSFSDSIMWWAEYPSLPDAREKA